MKRVYLAAGPWRQTGRLQYQRIVAYKSDPGLVVHTQTAEMLPGEVSLVWSGGDYPKGLPRLMEIWAARNAANTAAVDGDEPVFATPEQAALFETADRTKYR